SRRRRSDLSRARGTRSKPDLCTFAPTEHYHRSGAIFIRGDVPPAHGDLSKLRPITEQASQLVDECLRHFYEARLLSDVGKAMRVHNRWRTRASASLNVGVVVAYHAVWQRTPLAGEAAVERGPCARSVTIEMRPSRAGVVRRIARSDHLRSRLDAEVG